VLSLAELREAGVTRQQRRGQVEAERWRRLPHRGVVIDHGPLDGPNLWRSVLLHVGAEARLGGGTALRAGGLVGLENDPVHIWVEKSTRKGNPFAELPDVVLHETRRWGKTDLADDDGVPRAAIPVAAMQGALWARTLREATLFLIMPVQQRLVEPEQLLEQLDRVRRHRFRRALRPIIADIRGGSHSMNELDVLDLCRGRGLPEPRRQSLRVGVDGKRYIDAEWPEYGVTLEVQGAGHGELLRALDDDVRLVELSTEGSCAVSISVLTLRANPDAFFRAFAELLASRGWLRPAS